jgi:hypothetical protein
MGGQRPHREVSHLTLLDSLLPCPELLLHTPVRQGQDHVTAG